MHSSWKADIVVVGAGISGLATALALHRKGISSVVLEKSDSLRSNGAGIGVHANAWRALDQLGVGPILREKALPFVGLQDISLDKGTTREVLLGKEESRCLLRRDLIQALFDSLPPGTVLFGCHVCLVKTDPISSQPILHFLDGSIATAKIVIGCDGANSRVARSLKLKPARKSPMGEIRGVTRYPHGGHGFPHVFLRTTRGPVQTGRMPINHNLVYWFVCRPWLPKDPEISGKTSLIRQTALESVEGFPSETIQMIMHSCDASLTYKRLNYKAPWDVLLENFRQGSVTVAGDAMHEMGPFLGQGGASSLEDAVVLARCLAPTIGIIGSEAQEVDIALDNYVKERRMRVATLSMQTYLHGLLRANPALFWRGLILLVLTAISCGAFRPTQYDCGTL